MTSAKVSHSLQKYHFTFFIISWGGVRLNPLGTPIVRMEYEYGAFGGMRIGRGDRSIRRKPASVTLCLPQIPNDLTWDRTRAAEVGSRRLTA
jgi:hypothetical protein